MGILNNLPESLPPGTLLALGLARRRVQRDGRTTQLEYDRDGRISNTPNEYSLAELYGKWEILNSFEAALIEIVETAE